MSRRGPLSEETKAKISEAKRGKKYGSYGEERRAIIAVGQKARRQREAIEKAKQWQVLSDAPTENINW